MSSMGQLREVLEYDPATGIFRWKISAGNVSAGQIAGTYDRKGYTILRYKGVGYKAHRVAWYFVHGVLPLEALDHINRSKSDNRICNLRIAYDNINQINTNFNKTNKTGITGVTIDARTGHFIARISNNRIRIQLCNTPDFFEACCQRKYAEKYLGYGDNV